MDVAVSIVVAVDESDLEAGPALAERGQVVVQRVLVNIHVAEKDEPSWQSFCLLQREVEIAEISVDVA